MNKKEKASNLKEEIFKIQKTVGTISERQNSQYTDIMLQLKELKDEMRNKNIVTKDNRSVDELYDDALKAVTAVGKASTSYIQRKLGVGYSRAAQLMDALEEKGVIGPTNGSKPREVIDVSVKK